MKKGWTTTKLMAIGGLAALTVVLQLLGAGINALAGTVGASVINTILGSAMIAICLFVVDQFGAATIMYTVFGVLALPFSISGTPGFLPKVPIMIAGGIILDILYLVFQRNKQIASLVIGGLRTLYVGVAVIEVGRLFGMPGIEQSAKFLYSAIGIASAFVLGAIGGYLGYIIYQKIKSTSIVLRIKGK